MIIELGTPIYATNGSNEIAESYEQNEDLGNESVLNILQEDVEVDKDDEIDSFEGEGFITDKKTGFTYRILDSTSDKIHQLSIYKCEEIQKNTDKKDGKYILPQKFDYNDICYEVISIDQNAFAELKRLEQIIIPDNIISIEKDAFQDKQNYTIFCNSGSYAEKFAKDNMIDYITDSVKIIAEDNVIVESFTKLNLQVPDILEGDFNITWSISDGSIGAVDQDNILYGYMVGEINVSCNIEGLKAGKMITVNEPEADELISNLKGSTINFDGGDGTKTNPYRISSCEQLAAINKGLNKYYILNNDIDLKEYNAGEWDALGDYDAPFSGCLDGNNHKIVNLHRNKENASRIEGLIGYAGSCEIKNLTVSFNDCNGSGYMGLIARCKDPNSIIEISNCKINGQLKCETELETYVGGFIGQVENGSIYIFSSYFEGDIELNQISSKWSDYAKAGGYIANVEKGTVKIANSNSVGSITVNSAGGSVYNGAFVGSIHNSNYVEVTNSHSDMELALISEIWTVDEANISFRDTYCESTVKCGLVSTIYSYLANSTNIKLQSCFLNGNTSQSMLGSILGTDTTHVTISDCEIKGDGQSEERYSGRLINYMRYGSISLIGCKYEGTFNHQNNEFFGSAGGLLGYVKVDYCEIKDCNVKGEQRSFATYSGGLIGGVICKKLVMTNCYVEGNVAGYGGLVGFVDDSEIVEINNCNYTGKIINPTMSRGGIIGGIIGNCLNAKKVIVKNSNISGSIENIAGSAGGVIGSATASTEMELINTNTDIRISSLTDTPVRHNNNIGGLIGAASGDCLIKDCNANVDIDIETGEGFTTSVGGFIGWLSQESMKTKIINCHGTGNVSSKNLKGNTSAYAGGILGYLQVDGYESKNTTVDLSFEDSDFMGEIFGTSAAGGLLGYSKIIYWNSCYDGQLCQLSVNNCNFSGSLTSEKYAGGILGYDQRYLYCKVIDSNVDADISGNLCAGGLAGYNCGGCYAENTSVQGMLFSNEVAGGVLGDGYNAEIINCTISCNLKLENAGNALAGGMIGRTTQKSVIVDSTYNGNIELNNNETVNTGGILGVGKRTEIKNVEVRSDITVNNTPNIVVGGILGYQKKGSYYIEIPGENLITNSSTQCLVKINNHAELICGGIVGKNEEVIRLKDCSSKTNFRMTGNKTLLGGIIGTTTATAYLSSCEYEGNVKVSSGESILGGLAGKANTLLLESECKFITFKNAVGAGSYSPKTLAVKADEGLVVPKTINIAVGEEYVALANLYLDGELQFSEAIATWTSEDSAIASAITNSYSGVYSAVITGKNIGNTKVKVATSDGYSAEIIVNVTENGEINNEKDTKQYSGGVGNLSGSQNYVVKEKVKIEDDLSINSKFHVASKAVVQGMKLVVKSGGELIVEGEAEFSDIMIEGNGKVTVMSGGYLKSGLITARGGLLWSKGGCLEIHSRGFCRALNIILKNNSIMNMYKDAQVVVIDVFTIDTSSTDSEFYGGDLFIGQQFIQRGNKNNFRASKEHHTIFYRSTDSPLNCSAANYLFGAIYVIDSATGNAVKAKLSVSNILDRCKLFSIKSDNSYPWTYTVWDTTFDPSGYIDEAEWQKKVLTYYKEIANSGAYQVNCNRLSVEQSKAVNQLTAIWMGTLKMPLYDELLGIGNTQYCLRFKLKLKDNTTHYAMLRYNAWGAGSYAQFGAVKLILDDENREYDIGVYAKGSIDDFAVQAGEYVRDQFWNEYISYTTGIYNDLFEKSVGWDMFTKFITKILCQKSVTDGASSIQDISSSMKSSITKCITIIDTGVNLNAMFTDIKNKSIKSSFLNITSVSDQSLNSIAEDTSCFSEQLLSEIADELIGSYKASATNASISVESLGITDSHLADALEQKLGLTEEGNLAIPSLDAVKMLDLSNCYIKDLRGIDNFRSLKVLSINHNEIVDISPLKELQQLEYLDIGNNQILDLLPIAELKELKVLEAENNSISEISAISGLKELQVLRISENKVLQIHTLSQLSKLQELNVSGNPLKEQLSVLNHLERLEKLFAYECEMSNLGEIMLPNLKVLDISNNYLESLGELKKCVKMNELNASFNQLRKVDVEQLSLLESIDLSNNLLENIDGIFSLSKLQLLNLSSNKLSDKAIMQLKSLSGIVSINLSANPLFGFKMFIEIPNLKCLDISYTQIDNTGTEILRENGITVINMMNTILPYSIEFEDFSKTVTVGDSVYNSLITYPADADLTDVVFESKDQNIVTVSEVGIVEGIGEGQTKVLVRSNGLETSYQVTVQKKTQVISTQTSFSKKYGDADFNLGAKLNSGDGKLTYQSSNNNIVSVASDGKATLKGVGTVQITVTASETAKFLAVSKKITIKVSKGTQSIKASKEYKKAYGSKPFSISASAIGKLYYKSGNTKVVTISSSGKVTIKGIGSTVITITADKTNNYNTATKKVTIHVTPRKVTIRSVKALGERSVKITWNQDKKVTGYKITIARDKAFKKSKSVIKIAGNKVVSKTIKKLLKGKTYYVKIQGYKVAGGKTIYSSDSEIKKVTVK